MSDQQLHDDIENMVTALNAVIPELQKLGDAANDNIDTKLDSSLRKVDVKVRDLNKIIDDLQDGAEANRRYMGNAQRDALHHLQQGVELLIQTEVNSEYSNQIARIIADLEPLVASKLDREIEKLVEHKKLVISDHNEQVVRINTQLESNMTIIHTTLLESIGKLNTASADAHTRVDKGLEDINDVIDAHQDSLQAIQDLTTSTATNMQKNLQKIERSAVFMSQSPATMTALTAGFLSLCLMLSIVYRYDLWLPMVVSAIGLAVLLACVWCLVAWLHTRGE